MNKQRGGTILGLVIGLVFGLAIAVVVAVMITKTPTPFTNKLGMTKPVDTPMVQLTDPNKPLYGNSYREAPAHPAVRAPMESVPESVDATPVVTHSPEPKPKTEHISNVEEKAATYLQVGAFRDANDAENVRAKLALIGIEANVNEKNSEGDNLFRVRVGPFDSVDEMNRTRKLLAENSIDVAVIKTPK